MTMRIAWSLFLTGFVLGYGPCLVSCGPLLVSYISATQAGPRQGLKFYFVFSVTRLAVYMIFGVLAGFFGEWVIQSFFESPWLRWAFGGFGIFLIVLGALILLRRGPSVHSCPAWASKYLEGGFREAFVFSLIVSLSPCLPLLAVLGYIALISDTWAKGLIYMFSFGLGTVVSPLVLFCAAAGWLAKFSRRFEFWFMIVRILCAGVLVFLGYNLLSSM